MIIRDVRATTAATYAGDIDVDLAGVSIKYAVQTSEKVTRNSILNFTNHRLSQSLNLIGDLTSYFVDCKAHD